MCLSRISFSLGSSLLFAFVFALVLVLASLMKTRLKGFMVRRMSVVFIRLRTLFGTGPVFHCL